MKKNILAALIILLPCLQLFSQVNISGQLIKYPDSYIKIFSYKKANDFLLDSVKTSQTGEFSYNLSSNYKGMIKLKVFNMYYNFIINNENISFVQQTGNEMPDIKITESEENKIYYEFLEKKNKFLRKSNLLLPLVYEYPKEEKFYELTIEEYLELNNEFEKFLDKTIQEKENLFVSKIIQLERVPFVDPLKSGSEANQYYTENFFKYADFSDTAIINTPIFASKIIDYLSLYTSRTNTREQQEEAFKEAAINLMRKFYDYPDLYSFLINYLIEGFSQFGFDNVVDYIAENSDLEGSCKNELVNEELNRRIEDLKKLTIGKKAPVFNVKDINGKEITTSEVSSKHTLLLFWSSSCPYCHKILQKLSPIYDEYSREQLEIVIVSLDTSLTVMNDYLKDKNFPWITICDEKGWEGELATKYNIYATPFMFIVDENITIKAKPTNIRELEKFLKEE